MAAILSQPQCVNSHPIAHKKGQGIGYWVLSLSHGIVSGNLVCTGPCYINGTRPLPCVTPDTLIVTEPDKGPRSSAATTLIMLSCGIFWSNTIPEGLWFTVAVAETCRWCLPKFLAHRQPQFVCQAWCQNWVRTMIACVLPSFEKSEVNGPVWWHHNAVSFLQNLHNTQPLVWWWG